MSTMKEKTLPTISTRAEAMPPSPIRKLMPFADQARARGIHVYYLNIGQPDIETPEVMRARIRNLTERTLAYTPSGGTPAFLKAMQAYYKTVGVDLTLDQILATTGGSEALLFAMMAVGNYGDEGLVVEPLYTNYRSFAAMSGTKLVPLRTYGEDGFHLPKREVWEKAITAKTRFVLLCNPNNPTGTVYRRDELEMIASFCRDHGLFLILDEVYREFVYDGRTAISGLTLEGMEDHVIVVDSLSKRYSACGIRLGCLVTRNKNVYRSCMNMAQGRLSAPGLAQMMGAAATELGPEYREGVLVEYQKRRDVLFEGLTKLRGVFLRKPEGAFYFIARLPIRDSEHFAQWLLQEFSVDGRTVMVAPAPGFYVTPERGMNEVRIAYVLNVDDLRESVRLLDLALEQYCSKHGIDRDLPPAEAPLPDFHIPAES